MDLDFNDIKNGFLSIFIFILVGLIVFYLANFVNVIIVLLGLCIIFMFGVLLGR